MPSGQNIDPAPRTISCTRVCGYQLHSEVHAISEHDAVQVLTYNCVLLAAHAVLQ
jgi:hypothetical protein